MKNDYPPRILRVVKYIDNETLKDDAKLDVASYFKLSYFYERSDLKGESNNLIRHNVNDSDFYINQNDTTMTLNILGEIGTDNKSENTIRELSYNS